jgi:opacity protein-like surface antigen
MNKFIKLLTVAALLGSTAVANAADNSMYLLLEGGYAKTAAKDKILLNNTASKAKKAGTGVFAVGAGYRFDSNFRTDVTLNFAPTVTTKLKGTTSKSKVKSFATMANGYYDITAFGDTFTPYVGAGFGVAAIKYKSETATTSKAKGTQFAWQVGAGTLVKVTDAVDLKVGYRYMNLGGVKQKTTGLKTKFASHQFVAGVQFSL